MDQETASDISSNSSTPVIFTFDELDNTLAEMLESALEPKTEISLSKSEPTGFSTKENTQSKDETNLSKSKTVEEPQVQVWHSKVAALVFAFYAWMDLI